MKKLNGFSNSSGSLNEKQTSTKKIFEGQFLNLFEDEVIAADNIKGKREYFTHPGAVAIVPILKNGNLLIERQWRYPINRAIIEFPAGKLDRGEDPLPAAKRELEEETGFSSNSWCNVGKFFPAPAYSDEVIFLYFANSVEYIGNQNTDPGECIELFEVSLDEFFKMVESNEIVDAKTLVLALWLKRMKEGLFKPRWKSY